MTNPANDITAQMVADYLVHNPGFFLDNEALLADLHLPHGSGSATSLLERQVRILRERNIDTRKRLNEMLEYGQKNDILFNKTRELVLTILDSKSLADLSKRITNYCENEFQVDGALLTLIANPDIHSPISSCRMLSIGETERAIPSLLKSSECISGAFRPEELRFLFADKSENLASAIVLPILLDQKIVGFLALGAEDPMYFKSGMDTLFLKFIGDVVSHLLPRFFK